MATRKSDLSVKQWNKQKIIERKLASSLGSLTRRVEAIANKYHTVEQITAAIADLTQSPSWRKIALSEAVRMVQGVAVQNARTWREAARRGQKSREIFQALKAEISHHPEFLKLIRRNAQYISSLPNDIALHVTKHMATQGVRGMRAESLAPYLRRKAPELSEARINLIARTETAKTQASITQVRAQQVGVQYYVWRTAEDQRVRSSHKHMHGVACRYDSPPSPEALKGEESVGYYGPGEIWNCRCYAEPIIDAEDLPASIRVVQGGQIVRMSRAKFEVMSQ